MSVMVPARAHGRLAWPLAMSLIGCASARTPDAPAGDAGAPDAGRDETVHDALDAGEQPSRPADAGHYTPSDERCGRTGSSTGSACPDPLADDLPRNGYFALPTDAPGSAYRCVRGSDPCAPAPFATLAQCLEACEPASAQSASACSKPGDGEPVCDASLAGSAELTGQTPFGPLALGHGYLTRTNGFTRSVGIVLTADARLRSSAVPSLRVDLPLFPDEPASLAGSHELRGQLWLCDDRYVELPVRLTVVIDELVPGVSERFEGELMTDEPGFDLGGKFAFDSVCARYTDI